MGVVQSIFCSITFCVERTLTWTCCAFLLILLMFTLVMLMIYGISVGYHYAQKELASFSMSTRTTTEESLFGDGGGGRRSGPDLRPVVRLVAVNQTQEGHVPQPELEIYRTSKPKERVYLETSETPIIFLETERPPREPELSPSERELAKKLIGRFRRSRNLTEQPFLHPLNTRPTPETTSSREASLIRSTTSEPFLRPLSFRNGLNYSRFIAS